MTPLSVRLSITFHENGQRYYHVTWRRLFDFDKNPDP